MHLNISQIDYNKKQNKKYAIITIERINKSIFGRVITRGVSYFKKIIMPKNKLNKYDLDELLAKSQRLVTNTDISNISRQFSRGVSHFLYQVSVYQF